MAIGPTQEDLTSGIQLQKNTWQNLTKTYIYRPVHGISILIAPANIKCSDASVHTHRRTRAFATSIYKDVGLGQN